MKSLGFAAIVLALVATPASALGKRDSGMPKVMAPKAGAPAIAPRPSRWQAKRNGRWMGGWNAPGGWGAYRTPIRGAVLPGYWINPSYYIGNYSLYGFSRPQPGYGWSRYYDDAVLTDRDGRIQDSVMGVNWDRYDDPEIAGEDYSDSYGYREDIADRGPPPPPVERPKDRDGGLGGAAIGAVVGGVAGNVIGGKGNRTAGTLLGAGLGAVAGGVIDAGDRAGRGYGRGGGDFDDYGYDYPRGKKMKHRKHKHRDHHGNGGYDYGDGYGNPQHWGVGSGRYGSRAYYRGGYPYYYNTPHYYYYQDAAPQVITIQSAPVITTTTTTTEEVIYSKARKRVWHPRKRVWRPRPKCVC